METFSEPFRKTLLECLMSPKRVLATIRYNSQPFTDEVKRMNDTLMLHLAKENYQEVKSAVKEWLNNG